LYNQSNFVELKNASRIWAVGSIHSNLESLFSISNYILKNFKDNDKLIFLGNVIGLGKNSKETISSIINLRFNLMAKHKLDTSSIVFLRGAQEEMFNKLLQLQTAPNPEEIINWMFNHGVDKTLESYEFNPEDIRKIVSQGTIQISKWTSKLNLSVVSTPGNKEYFSNLKHAAFSETKKILFVNRGVDVSRPLSAQNDCFWWGYQNFSLINEPYNSFKRIVRGYQSTHVNDIANSKSKVICTLFRQPLMNKKILGGVFDENANIIDLFEST